MKIELTEDRMIKGKPYEAGETATVTKDLGERLISKGLANRIIVEVENRAVVSDRRQFCGHTRFK